MELGAGEIGGTTPYVAMHSLRIYLHNLSMSLNPTDWL